VVKEVEKFIAFIPYASRFPYEIWILPRRHCAFFFRDRKRRDIKLCFYSERSPLALKAIFMTRLLILFFI
jgi:hypothetical protein